MEARSQLRHRPTPRTLMHLHGTTVSRQRDGGQPAPMAAAGTVRRGIRERAEYALLKALRSD